MRDFENEIKAAFESRTPDMKERLLSRIDKEAPTDIGEEAKLLTSSRKRGVGSVFRVAAIAAMFVVVFTVGILLGNFVGLPSSDSVGELASLYIDVNPSIELVVNESGSVEKSIAANPDAEAILSDMKLEGVELNTALNAIIGAMYMGGYLTDDANSILVSSSAASPKFDGLLKSAVDNVDSIMKRANLSCSIIAQSVTKDEKTEEMANKNNVSVGKMSLINKIVSELDDYTEDDAETLCSMPVKDLNLIYSSMPKHDKHPEAGDGSDERDDGIFEIGGIDIFDFISKDAAKEALLEYLELDEDEVDDFTIYVRHTGFGVDMKMIYKASFELDGTLYEYEIDCLSAEITLVKQTPANEHGKTDIDPPDIEPDIPAQPGHEREEKPSFDEGKKD